MYTTHKWYGSFIYFKNSSSSCDLQPLTKKNSLKSSTQGKTSSLLRVSSIFFSILTTYHPLLRNRQSKAQPYLWLYMKNPLERAFLDLSYFHRNKHPSLCQSSQPTFRYQSNSLLEKLFLGLLAHAHQRFAIDKCQSKEGEMLILYQSFFLCGTDTFSQR